MSLMIRARLRSLAKESSSAVIDALDIEFVMGLYRASIRDLKLFSWTGMVSLCLAP